MSLNEAYRTPNRMDQKKKFSTIYNSLTPSVQNNARIPKAIREKDHVTYKGRPIRIHAFSQQRL